jgi:hypothetical protein
MSFLRVLTDMTLTLIRKGLEIGFRHTIESPAQKGEKAWPTIVGRVPCQMAAGKLFEPLLRGDPSLPQSLDSSFNLPMKGKSRFAEPRAIQIECLNGLADFFSRYSGLFATSFVGYDVNSVCVLFKSDDARKQGYFVRREDMSIDDVVTFVLVTTPVLRQRRTVTGWVVVMCLRPPSAGEPKVLPFQSPVDGLTAIALGMEMGDLLVVERQ